MGDEPAQAPPQKTYGAFPPPRGPVDDLYARTAAMPAAVVPSAATPGHALGTAASPTTSSIGAFGARMVPAPLGAAARSPQTKQRGSLWLIGSVLAVALLGGGVATAMWAGSSKPKTKASADDAPAADGSARATPTSRASRRPRRLPNQNPRYRDFRRNPAQAGFVQNAPAVEPPPVPPEQPEQPAFVAPTFEQSSPIGAETRTMAPTVTDPPPTVGNKAKKKKKKKKAKARKGNRKQKKKKKSRNNTPAR